MLGTFIFIGLNEDSDAYRLVSPIKGLQQMRCLLFSETNCFGGTIVSYLLAVAFARAANHVRYVVVLKLKDARARVFTRPTSYTELRVNFRYNHMPCYALHSAFITIDPTSQLTRLS